MPVCDTSIDLTRLENLRMCRGAMEARCPACAEQGGDRTGNHLQIRTDGRWGCVAHAGDTEHRRRIFKLVAVPFEDRVDFEAPPMRSVSLPALKRHDWPWLSKGTREDLHRLSDLRGITVDGLELAVRRGILRFANDKRNGRLWCVTDDRRFVRQDRRLDGSPVILRNGKQAKSRTIGNPRWPVGLDAAEGRATLMLTEGAPDLLAAHHLIWAEDRAKDAAAVGIVGSGMPIHAEALSLFDEKRVRIFVHNDEKGRQGALAWWRAVYTHAEKVDAYKFEALVQESGEGVNDLNDFLHVRCDYWERRADIREVIP